MDVEKYRSELEHLSYAPWKDKVFDLLDAYDALRNEYVDLFAQAAMDGKNLQAVLDMHSRHPAEGMADEYCTYDGVDWPCLTVRAARGERWVDL